MRGFEIRLNSLLKYFAEAAVTSYIIIVQNLSLKIYILK